MCCKIPYEPFGHLYVFFSDVESRLLISQAFQASSLRKVEKYSLQVFDSGRARAEQRRQVLYRRSLWHL